MCIKVKSKAKMNGAISQSKIYNALFVSIFSPNCTVESYFRKVPQFEKDIYIYTTIILSQTYLLYIHAKQKLASLRLATISSDIQNIIIIEKQPTIENKRDTYLSIKQAMIICSNYKSLLIYFQKSERSNKLGLNVLGSISIKIDGYF